MPKARSKRLSNLHTQSAKLNKRHFAADGKIEHVGIGEKTEATGDEILRELAAVTEKQPLTKKEKQQQKRDTFLQRLEHTSAPYSKSHARRLKRKAKEEIAQGMQDLASALPTIEDFAIDEKTDSRAMNVDSAPRKLVTSQRTTQIGEGSGFPLSKGQRKRVLKVEKLRQPLLLAIPEFADNPFQAIRTHALNTLVKRQAV